METETLQLVDFARSEGMSDGRGSIFDRIARSWVTRRLNGLVDGQLTLRDLDRDFRFGPASDLGTSVVVHRPRFYRRALLGGTLAVADSYIQGDWDCDDLTSLFRIFLRNDDTSNRLDNLCATWRNLGHRLMHLLRANTRRGSRKNIQAHYDLGNDFYGLWLDETMAYSSGIFPTPEATMEQASIEKFDRVCRKLNLGASDSVLEIGSGFGGFAMHAAKYYGCHVTTTTISREQFAFARARIDQEGLADRITLLDRDYRDLRGPFDKIVSIEMIEAVGHRYLDQFFRKCGKLLREDGTMVLQSIVMPERRHEAYLNSVDFIQRYVFPGGSLPSLASLLASAGRTTRLRFVHAEDFAPHYAETLRRWRQGFLERVVEVRRLRYPERFLRLWNYYLCYCEAAFEERYIGVLQVQFDGPRCNRDPIAIGQRAPFGASDDREASPERRAKIMRIGGEE